MCNRFIFENYPNGKIGKIITTHGEIETPAFIFCGTKGAIKGLDHHEIFDSTQILLCNTFHLHNYADNIEKLGGLHKFINWNKPIITDSGGFQIFSLGNGYVANEIKGVKFGTTNFTKITEDGCFFKNPINGDSQFFSAINSMQTQIKLGVDLAISFDECTTSNAGYDYTKNSMYRSHRWEQESLDYFNINKKPHQSLYGIVQGGTYEDLRLESIDFVNSRDFFGICIGGSLGKTKQEMYDIVKFISKKLDRTRPIHLLGIGRIEDILHLYPYVDTFDCVEPTRIARHGTALIKKGRLNLRNSKFITDNRPIENDCPCLTCQRYSRAYIAYLLKVNEISSIQLIVRHNIFYMNQFMKELRATIQNHEDITILKNKWLMTED